VYQCFRINVRKLEKIPHLNGDFAAHTAHLLFKATAELLQAQIAEVAVFQGGLLRPVFRTRDFLRRIRILGSSYTGLRIRTLLFASLTFEMPTKISLYKLSFLLITS
jgi:hypothetical protein